MSVRGQDRHVRGRQPSACIQNTARLRRLHRQSGFSTLNGPRLQPHYPRSNAGSSTPPPRPRQRANRTNRRTRIQNLLEDIAIRRDAAALRHDLAVRCVTFTRAAITFTDGRTSTGDCDYPVHTVDIYAGWRCSAKREISPHAEHRYAPSLINYTHMTHMANGAITRLSPLSCWRAHRHRLRRSPVASRAKKSIPGVTAGATAPALRVCRRLRKAAF